MSVIQDTLVTPDLATKWLSKNIGNRPLRAAIVRLYAHDIAAGKWQQNGETIKLSADGTLLDGQHRLHAIVSAGKSARMLVVSGLQSDSFHTIDTGMRRTSAQLVGMAGRANASVLASLARWLVLIETSPPDQIGRGSVSSQQVFDAIERHPLAVHFAARHREKGTSALLPSAVQSVMVLAAEKYGQEVPDGFLNSFSTGEGLKKGDPVFELRERMIQNSSRVAKITTQTVVALTIKAVRAYATQRVIGVLRWSPNEEWPQV